MTKGQRTIELTAKLYEIRRTVKSMLSEKYAAKMREYSDGINQVMTHQNVDVMSAATRLCEAADNPYQKLVILAAAVELVDPSEPV